MAMGARFQKLRGVKYQGAEFSEGKGELNSQTGLDSGGLEGYHVFLQTCYICGSIIIDYSCHYVYSKMILENDSPILNLCCIGFFYSLGDYKFI